MAKDRRIIKTKTAIREAFISIIKQKDAPKITVTEIAKQANIDRKTFYLHYGSIEDLINEFYQELTSKLLLILNEIDYADLTFDVTSLFESLNRLIDEDIELYRHMVKTPSFYPLWQEIKNIIKSVLVEAMTTELDMSPSELELYAEFYSAGVTSAYLLWLKNEVDLTEKEVAHIVGTAAFYGFQELLPRKDE